LFEEIHAVEEGVGVGDEVVAVGEGLGARWAVGEDEWGDCISIVRHQLVYLDIVGDLLVLDMG